MSILELLKKLDAEATPGPWRYLHAYRDTPEYLREANIGTRSEEIISRDSGVYGPSTEDAELIIHMRNALPKLLNIIEAALKAGRAMRDSYYTSKVAPGDNLDFDNAVDNWDEATKEDI